jgi:Spy/CpxP family protein refolding chaperone
MMRTPARTLGAALGALLLAAATPAAFAQHGGPGRHGDARGPHGPGERHGSQALFQLLELDEQQRQAWTEAHRAHFEAQRPTFEKMRDLREQMHAELESEAPDAATVGGYLISIHALDGELEAARGELEAAIRDILTDEQEIKLEAWKAANPGRRHGPGPGGPGWGGPHRGDRN